jgi:hypothetical protein
MSGTYPVSYKGFQTVDFQINTPSLITQTFSGKTRRLGQGHQYYTFGVKYPQLVTRDFGPILAFVAAQAGPVDSFTIVLPDVSYSKAANAAAIGSPVTQAALTAGQKTCVVSGLTPNTNQVLRAGDFFKFANHTKVYMAVADLNANGSGVGTLNFAGALVESVGSGVALITDQVPFTVCIDSDVQEFSLEPGMTSFEIKMRETW